MSLEADVRVLFMGWASYRKWTRCKGCGLQKHCGAHRRAGPWLCLDCFDLSVAATAFIAKRNGTLGEP